MIVNLDNAPIVRNDENDADIEGQSSKKKDSLSKSNSIPKENKRESIEDSQNIPSENKENMTESVENIEDSNEFSFNNNR